MSIENPERESSCNSHHSVLAELQLVPDAAGDVLRYCPSPSTEQRPAVLPPRSPSSTLSRRESNPRRLEALRDRWHNKGLSAEVVDLLLAGTRNTTHAAYQSAWASWNNWCLQWDEDPMSASISSILQYLAELHNAGKSYSLLNVHRSMLSSMVEHSGTVPVGQLPAVKQLLKGAYNRNPPKPKYSRTWDVNVVLDYLSALGPNQDLGLPMLSRKLAMLLALSTLFRVSELSSIVFSSVEFSPFGASFNLGRTTKTQHSGTLRVVRLPRLKDNILCPVDCLGWYVTITGPSRNAANRDELFYVTEATI